MAHRIPRNKKLREEFLKRLETVCEAYFIRHLKLETIADDVGRARPMIRRYLKLAQEMGVVEFNIDASYAIGDRSCPELENRMEVAFELEHAIVIEPHDEPHLTDEVDDHVVTDDLLQEDPTDAADSEKKEEAHQTNGAEDHAAADDLLHVALANRAGGELISDGGVQEGDHIAVAGGRGVYRTVQRMKRRPPPRKNIRISPLCGRIWAHSWKLTGPDRIERPLDADDCAFVLAQAFEKFEGTVCTQIGMPLYADDQAQAQSIAKEYCAFLPDGQWNWGLKAPRLVIVGCGVIDPAGGHRMAEVNAQRPVFREAAPYLSRAADDLQRLISYADAENLPYPGDVANRLFPALPLPQDLPANGLDSYNEHFEVLNGMIQALNDRSLVMSWGHLRSASFVWCVAGGPLKVSALWTLLLAGQYSGRNDQLITAISTDARTAETLLDARKQLRRMPRPVQDWYREAVGQCFGR